MITAIICAAGSGTRAQLPENKIFHELNGLPVLCHSLSAFAPYADELLVACRKEDEARVKALLSPYPNAHTVIGGATRMQSVYNALQRATADMVLIHDAARPFVTAKIIEECIASVKEYGSGVCALAALDTTVLEDHGKIISVPDRSCVYTVQTPQGFLTERLLKAHEEARAEGEEFTDDSGLYAKYIAPPHLFVGDRHNRKLTLAEDFRPAERIGFGIDTHAFAKRNLEQPYTHCITLAGAKIPSHAPLLAHSDGDVITHALMDALLSAIGKRDIGYYFPDSDPTYSGADSMRLLSQVLDMVRAQSLSIHNVSISVLAETPRLSPYIEEMRENLKAALSCENVAIAAGTNEKLGYVGEGKGITVYAAVLLK
ncbi:MAG: 2-C-methyl-D-erythritol 4-phosphate cytidylyltransferase [Clostridia bacterium]|nr:2-C-methyl-D-erythritol 4-phosphate cytidylyltransferase [Clostridia bacterium]